MSEPYLDVHRFIALVEARGPASDPLGLVDTASVVHQEIVELADRAVEHFVLEARRDGHSWTAIGERLGVSKQAARQRFADQPMTVLGGDLEVRPRLQACLDQARAAAEHDGSAEIQTHHLLLGLLHAGVGAAALDRLGVTRDRVRESVRRLFDAPPTAATAATGAPGLPADAARALDEARRLARDKGHTYVGTEHLLFVLAADPGSQTRRVLTDLGVELAAVQRELAGVLCPAPRRRRRRRHHQEPRCSFCGSTRSAVRLVAGPGVCICERCVQFAGEQLSRPGGD